jgi:hypothetical protein
VSSTVTGASNASSRSPASSFTVVTVIAVFHDAAVIRAERVVLYSLVTAYVTFSAVVMILGRVAPNAVLRGASVIHVVDVFVAAGVTLLTAGVRVVPSSYFLSSFCCVTSVQSSTTAALLTAAAIAVLFLAGLEVGRVRDPQRTGVETDADARGDLLCGGVDADARVHGHAGASRARRDRRSVP